MKWLWLIRPGRKAGSTDRVENSDGEGMPTISRQWAAIGRLVRGEGDQRPAQPTHIAHTNIDRIASSLCHRPGYAACCPTVRCHRARAAAAPAAGVGRRTPRGERQNAPLPKKTKKEVRACRVSNCRLCRPTSRGLPRQPRDQGQRLRHDLECSVVDLFVHTSICFAFFRTAENPGSEWARARR